jgi:hypothetical protein
MADYGVHPLFLLIPPPVPAAAAAAAVGPADVAAVGAKELGGDATSVHMKLSLPAPFCPLEFTRGRSDG